VDPQQVTCRPDCTFCGDGNVDASDSETCDDGNDVSGCDPQHPTKALDECQTNCTAPICHDPAKILLGSTIDRFDLHARLTSDAVVDFTGQTFVVELTDPLGGVIYRASLDADAITGDAAKGKFKFKNNLARAAGGVAALKITKHVGGYRATIKMYGDLTKSQANMTTRVYLQDDMWTVVGLWVRTHKGWKFTDAR
jgi:hypothetical protein